MHRTRVKEANDAVMSKQGQPDILKNTLSRQSIIAIIKYLLSLEYEYIIGGILTSVLMIMLFINVIGRYFFNYSFAVTEDLSRFAFVWIVYIGAIVAARYGIHFRVKVQLLLLPEKTRKYVLLLADLIWFSLCILVVFYGVQVIADMFKYPMKSATVKINVVYAWAIVPIAFSLMAIRLAYRRYYEFREDMRKEKDVIAQK